VILFRVVFDYFFRFVFISWNAPDVPHMERGKIVFQSHAVRSFLLESRVPMFSIELDNLVQFNQVFIPFLSLLKRVFSKFVSSNRATFLLILAPPGNKVPPPPPLNRGKAANKIIFALGKHGEGDLMQKACETEFLGKGRPQVELSGGGLPLEFGPRDP